MTPGAPLRGLLGGRPQRLPVLLAWIVAGGGGYGAVMGLYGGPLQAVYSAVKVPLLLGVSFALTLPAFAVTGTLAGLRDDLGRAVRATAAAPAATAVVLASLAPFTALWYASDRDYGSAILFNGGLFAAAVIAAGVVLRRAYRDLIAGDRRHRFMLVAWLVGYAFIAVQMAWVLRPFVGGPGETTFFRHAAWGNAYVQVGEMIRERVQHANRP